MSLKRSRTTDPLKILYVCAELSPWATTGGLGDVAAALPRALKSQGHDVRIALPCYGRIPPEMRGEPYCMCVADLGAKTVYGAMRTSIIPETEIPLYLVEHEAYFGRDDLYGYGDQEYGDNVERFCFFSMAVLHGVAQTYWRPDIVHCHDWHTAVVPVYIKTRLANTKAWNGMPTLFTIHNIAYQGRYKADVLAYTGLARDLFTPECLEFHGDINLIKAGIVFASKLNTVSPRYAQEIQTPEYGEGLDGLLRTRGNSLHGILNGVDYTQWNPARDPDIAENYSAADLTGKRTCKIALQRLVSLPESDVPLIGIVSRLSWQKGADLVAAAMDAIMPLDVQLVILGAGDPQYERRLSEAAARYPNQVRLLLKFDTLLAHQIEAGSDFFLMPSRYEPCGLNQMYSLAYGTVPIVRETGGLADSVRHITPTNLKKGKATGIKFGPSTAEAITEAVRQAVHLYQDPAAFHVVREAGMKEDFSWDRSSKAYLQLYRQAMAKP